MQGVVDWCAPLIDTSCEEIRYIYLDLFDVLFQQGALDESPLAEYSECLDAFGQHSVTWDKFIASTSGDGRGLAEFIFSDQHTDHYCTESLVYYGRLLREEQLFPSQKITDPGLALPRLMSTASISRYTHRPNLAGRCNTLASHSRHIPLSVESINAWRYRYQSYLEKHLAMSSDLYYLSDTVWFFNFRLYLSLICAMLTEKGEDTAPLVALLTLMQP